MKKVEKTIAKIICFIFGHNMREVRYVGRTRYNIYRCTRCGQQEYHLTSWRGW